MRKRPASARHPGRLPRRRLYRAAFLAAGLYNLGWGLHAVMDPQWLFRFAGMPLPNHPEVFACLGMVIGLYGVLYLEVARFPEQTWPVAAVGMAGKILGPLGFAHLLLAGQWPLRAGIIVLTNDLLWWLPFGLYLHDAASSWTVSWWRSAKISRSSAASLRPSRGFPASPHHAGPSPRRRSRSGW
jgi:hypothetical protein